MYHLYGMKSSDAWIATGCDFVSARLEVGVGCIIGAGSVVNKDCLPHALYAGNPAKRIKDLLQTSEI